MDGSAPSDTLPTDVVVIGAGMAGLAATVRLSAIGLRVVLLERHGHMGGKVRTVPSIAGPVAAGPTVLTMRHVFDDLFALAGTRMEDHVALQKQSTLARHFWPDGSCLDLFDDHQQSVASIERFAGPRAAQEFKTFSARTRTLFDAFDAPMMRRAEPNMRELTGTVLRQPSLIPMMAPLSTLRSVLKSSFSDPRLRQLFGRYATYVGGAPAHAPAILSLIWQAEAAGVWTVEGGISALAHALGDLARHCGARIHTGAHVTALDCQDGQIVGVQTENLGHFDCKTVVFAGDPRALAMGVLGHDVSAVAPQTLTKPRSFSARVHSFAAQVSGVSLAHHNVFFDDDPDAEFNDLMAGRLPQRPSFYICATDRGAATPPPQMERFEIITNAPARPDHFEEAETWHPKIMQKMARFGIRFHPMPTHSTVTTETDFATLFPESLGALYGQSPHGLTASLSRPTARTQIRGLYLAGGGCHPGAGVAMATLSAQHAVEAILNDRISGSASRQMAMHGGTSTA